MENFIMFFEALYDLSNAMAPYILFGLLFAGLLHELVPDSLVKNHLGDNSILSVIKATLFGIPLPVCSCGVIPLAAGMKKSGASNGATLSFLISTPITGVDSILATYGMFGWIFTLYRVVTSMIISIIAGILSNFYTLEVALEPLSEPKSCCSSDSCSTDAKGQRFSPLRIFKYAFETLLKDIASPLLLGLLLGALITILVPENLSQILLEYTWLSYLIAIVIAVPMYVCATASLPIAAGLILAGVSPGAAFVFLSAGPATNTVTMGVVKNMLGSTTLYIYLGSIVIGSILFGFGLDYLLTDVSAKELVHMDEEASFLAIGASILLWGYIIYYSIKPYFASVSRSSNLS